MLYLEKKINNTNKKTSQKIINVLTTTFTHCIMGLHSGVQEYCSGIIQGSQVSGRATGASLMDKEEIFV